MKSIWVEVLILSGIESPGESITWITWPPGRLCLFPERQPGIPAGRRCAAAILYVHPDETIGDRYSHGFLKKIHMVTHRHRTELIAELNPKHVSGLFFKSTPDCFSLVPKPAPCSCQIILPETSIAISKAILSGWSQFPDKPRIIQLSKSPSEEAPS